MKRGAALSAWAVALVVAAWFALRPVDREMGRFFFLPPKWAETLDIHDWAVNFFTLGLLAWLTMNLLNGVTKFRAAAVTLMLLAGCVVSVEWLQAWIPGRAVDASDVFSGISGVLAGIALALRQRLLQ